MIVDRAGASDAGKVVPEDDLTFRRNEVDVITQLVAGSRSRVVQLKDFLTEPATVGMVGNEVADERTYSNQKCQHRDSSGAGFANSESGFSLDRAAVAAHQRHHPAKQKFASG